MCLLRRRGGTYLGTAHMRRRNVDEKWSSEGVQLPFIARL